MSRKVRLGLYALAFAGLLAGLVLTGAALLAGGGSPAGLVVDRYRRDPARDIDGQARAFVATEPVSRVTAEVIDAWRPAARHVDASGVYLRYADDTVVIRPLAGGGTLILVEATSTAYPRYRSVLEGPWRRWPEPPGPDPVWEAER
ncbi:DUF4247 domain-containing protein [Actinoplanes sp. NPDC049548]|uniref:DUF4247 domain-containing protein n=1 Tax=Actinoplanes sp. NPDC049548 TaxID=3155152 RepID=UPI00342EA51B